MARNSGFSFRMLAILIALASLLAGSASASIRRTVLLAKQQSSGKSAHAGYGKFFAIR